MEQELPEHPDEESEGEMEDEEEDSVAESPPPVQPSKQRRTAAKGKPLKPVEQEDPLPARRPINTPARAEAGARKPKEAENLAGASARKPRETQQVLTTPQKKKTRRVEDASQASRQSAAPELAQPVATPPADQAASPALHRVKGKRSPDPKDELIRKLYADPCIFYCCNHYIDLI